MSEPATNAPAAQEAAPAAQAVNAESPSAAPSESPSGAPSAAPSEQAPSPSEQKIDQSPEAEKPAEAKESQAPIDYAKVDLGVADLDPVAVSRFADISKDLKLTPEQMQGLAKWQADFAEKQREEMSRAGIATLAKEYGPAFERMRADANALIARIDSATEGEFGKALGRVGALCDPGIAKGFMLIAQAFSEDSLGASGEAAAQLKPESAYDGLKAAFAKK